MSVVQPIIELGGQGSRLWPLSTPSMPKQFIPIGNKGTLVEATIDRITKFITTTTDYTVLDPLFIMNKDHTLPSGLSHHNKNIIYEEYGNDTAVAVARACLEIKKRHKDNVIILALPADHYVYNVDAFLNDIHSGITKVTDNNIVLYGIDPTSPETKYGYIIPSSHGITFREKPNLQTAITLIQNNALWNSGIFASKVDTVLNSLSSVMNWISHPRPGKAPSFDVVVLQEYKDIYCVHCKNWGWSDVGTWDAFTNIPDIREEIQSCKNVVLKDCNNVDVLNRDNGNVVVIGCNDIRVIVNDGNILIMSSKEDHNNSLKEIAANITK